ncbi:MAG: hypothetical protein RIC30_20965 [Marinoscillum sp.]|uniref:hypothetical protein n=1 Tax=Marinoscillum sp. TaxID=2024838 RepID=UPI0032F38974
MIRIMKYGWLLIMCLATMGCANHQAPIQVTSPDGKNVFVLSLEKGPGVIFEVRRLEENKESVSSRTRVKSEELALGNENRMDIELLANNGFAMHLVPLD